MAEGESRGPRSLREKKAASLERESFHLISKRKKCENPAEALIEGRDGGRKGTMDEELLNQTESSLRGRQEEWEKLCHFE